VRYSNSEKRYWIDPEFDIVHPDDSSDITFQSSDGVLFHLHIKYLEISTNGFSFPPDCASGESEIIPLKEAASILELLFRFCYPERHPDLAGMDFNDLLPLAEAVQKYKVFPAMNICKIRMR
jgi:hypothetical protein